MNKLKSGDCVSIIAPACRQTDDSLYMLDAGADVLKGWGLSVRRNYSGLKKHFYLAGDDAYRSAELLSAFNDPDVKAVFTTRGGYGCSRILPALVDARACNPKLLIGYSDICALMFACAVYLPQITSIHGPSVAVPAFLGNSEASERNRNRLYDVLFNANDAYQQDVTVIRPGTFEGDLVGGNLSIIVSLLGTPYEPQFKQKVLFLEDVGEKPYRIDRMLTQLGQAGKFEGVKGVVFGSLTDCVDSVDNVLEVIEDVLNPYSIPVVCGFEGGHGSINTAFVIGRKVKVDSDRSWLQIDSSQPK